MSRPTTLLLVRHGTTAETRTARFPASSGARAVERCAALDHTGRMQAGALAGCLPAADRVWASYARRCIETAMRCSPDVPVQRVAELAELDFGRWAGRDPEEVSRAEPEALAAWYDDPGSAPHGGERLAVLRERVAEVLRRAAALGGVTVAVTHGGVCKAALLDVLELDAPALWRLDVAPGSVTELHAAGRTWRVVRTNWRPRPEGWQSPAPAASLP